MPGGLLQTPLDDLTYRIIGQAMAAHRSLGPGHREDVYQRALEARLTESRIAFAAQQTFEVHDGDNPSTIVGFYIPDFVVESAVVVEIKALTGVDQKHIAQVIGYLAVTGCRIGLLINFGCGSLSWRRILPPRNIAEHRANGRWLFQPNWMR